MRLRCLVVSLLIAIILPPGIARAAAPTTAPANLGQNAAIDYLMASLWLRGWDAKQKQLIDQFDTLPLDKAGDLVPDRSSPLKFLRFGANRPWCDWGLHVDEEGFGALLPYLSDMRLLAKLGLLRARVDLRDGHPLAAADYWAADLALGRHAGAGAIPVSFLVGYGIEALTINHAATQLKELDKPALDHLSQLLDMLPPGPSLPEAARFDPRVNRHWLIPKLKQSNSQQWERLAADSFGATPEKIRAITRACGGTPASVAEKVQAMEPLYEQIAQAMSLPYEQFDRSYLAITAEAKANPVWELFNNDFSRIYHIAAAARARMELFRTAITVVRDGPEAAKTHADPFGNGPFTYRATPDGFELSSKLIDIEGHPVTVKVGQGGPK